ncbi:hypothetical protein ACFX13_044952 [Malus domestica]
MWYAIVFISESSDNNAQRYGSNLQKEAKAISQALIHGIMASLAIPRYGLIVGSYRHTVDLQYLIGCITLLETWWQEQSLNSKLIPRTSEFPTAFKAAAETRILLAHSPDMLLAMKWVLLVQHALSLAVFHAIYIPQELVYTLKLILNMSMFERLEDKPHLKGVGLMRL